MKVLKSDDEKWSFIFLVIYPFICIPDSFQLFPRFVVIMNNTSTRNIHRLHKYIYRYSRLGRVDLIKARIAQQDLSQEDFYECVSLNPHGESCLVAAARQGHLDVVKYLVEEAKVDVEQRGTVQFEGETLNFNQSSNQSSHVKVNFVPEDCLINRLELTCLMR